MAICVETVTSLSRGGSSNSVWEESEGNLQKRFSSQQKQRCFWMKRKGRDIRAITECLLPTCGCHTLGPDRKRATRLPLRFGVRVLAKTVVVLGDDKWNGRERRGP